MRSCAYIDLAVGAPLEGAGAVYIYRGGAGDRMTSRYSQRIGASDVGRMRLTNFGHSLGRTPGGLDVDASTYPDVVVGAYSARAVVVLRARPVVSVAASLSADPGTINPDERSCPFDAQSNNCFRLRVCLGYAAEPADRPVGYVEYD